MANSQTRTQFLLWLGAAISIAEIVTGTLMAPLGLGKGFLAIVIGHLIGCLGFLLPAAYLGAKRHQSAIESTEFVFGHWGVLLFSCLNGLQLLGWTAVMIVNAAQAMNGVSGQLFGLRDFVVMAAIIALLIGLWLWLDIKVLFKINNVIVLLLLIGSLIVLGLVLHTGVKTGIISGQMSFGAAVELNVTMGLSWLPLIGDYTQQTKRPFTISLASAGGYGLGSLLMFSIGLLLAARTGLDFATFLTHSGLGLIALLIIIFSTVTTTFMDAHSAAVSLQNVWPKSNTRVIALIVTAIGFVIALVASMQTYENFLYFIGSIFTPLYTIVFVSYFILKRPLPVWGNFIWWLIGVAGYYGLQRYDFVGGTTLLLAVLLGILVWLSAKVQRTVS
jgi:putative hydroxymethylpyrimidine transporter CytX